MSNEMQAWLHAESIILKLLTPHSSLIESAPLLTGPAVTARE